MKVGLSGFSSISGAAFHPLFGEELKYSVKVVGDDPDSQVEETIGLMREYALEDGQSVFQARGREILAAAGGSNKDAACLAWQEAKQIAFLRDEYAAAPLDQFLSRIYNGAPVIEVLIRPRDMAAMKNARYGDCDDFSMYVAALLVSMDIPCSYVTLAGDDSQPEIFSHVYVAAYPDGERIALDASHGAFCGWEAYKPWARKKEWPINHRGSVVGLLCKALGVGVLAWALWGAIK